MKKKELDEIFKRCGRNFERLMNEIGDFVYKNILDYKDDGRGIDYKRMRLLNIINRIRVRFNGDGEKVDRAINELNSMVYGLQQTNTQQATNTKPILPLKPKVVKTNIKSNNNSVPSVPTKQKTTNNSSVNRSNHLPDLTKTQKEQKQAFQLFNEYEKKELDEIFRECGIDFDKSIKELSDFGVENDLLHITIHNMYGR